MIQSILVFIVLNTVSVYLTHQLLDGFQITGGTFGYLMVGAIIGFLNLFLKPLLKVITLPFVFLSMGLFLTVINAFILWLSVKAIAILGIASVTFTIDGIATYVMATIVLGLSNLIFQKLL